MKILIIEDEGGIIDALRGEITNKFLDEYPDLRIEESGFEGAFDKIISLEPDVVISDISDKKTQSEVAEPDNEEGIEPGNKIVNEIWNRKFCPLIIYTGFYGKIENAGELEHPFVKIVRKGEGSYNKVIDELNNFIPHVKAMNKAEISIKESFRNTYHESMRHLAPYVFNPSINADQRIDILLRSGRRRFAALCDYDNSTEVGLESWEQYIFPPLADDLSLGDIIQKTDAKPLDPKSFRVILTPSCDLATQNRKPKVNDVLVSKCCPLPDALKKVSVSGRKAEDLISKMLNPGYCGVIIPFPELANIIPHMAANLRDLDLIKIDNIYKGGDDNYDSEEYEYKLIASLDSPFKELVSWAYQQVACRPGLPERNVEAWAEEILSATTQNTQNKEN